MNVLCEGPSIEALRPEDLLPGPTVAVNHALSLSGKVPIDFWATVDDPDLLWAWSERHRHEQVKLWTTENNTPYYQDFLGEAWEGRLYVWVQTFMEHLKEGDKKPPVIPTVVALLGWLSNMPGVEHVRMFGCDMVGTDSPLAAAGYSPDEDIGWEYRWIMERQLLALAFNKYRLQGKRIERWAKVPQRSRNLSYSLSRMLSRGESFSE